MPLSERELRLLKGGSHEASLFREGAECEARLRKEDLGVHRELADCLDALIEAHQDWTSADIALTLARIYMHVIDEDPV